MSPRRLFFVVFIEGFCSLGAEVIALRQVIPHMGSSIVVTAPTIGFFLLALALGYHAGGRVAGNYAGVVERNFLLAAVIAAAGLSSSVVDALFAALDPPVFAYLLFIALVLCPLSYLMGQTVPVLTNLLRHERAGERSGTALFHSTLGSFLGSLTLSLLLMQFVGVSAAVASCVGLLIAGALLLGDRRPRPAALAAAAIAGLAWFAGRGADHVADTAYADYRVPPVALPEMHGGRAFLVNNSVASIIDDSEPPRYTRYIEHIRALIHERLGLRGKDILVLGAGGFTLSHRELDNRYLYVDIDPQIRPLAERHFLRQPAHGRFIVDDARSFVTRTTERFDVIVVDVFSARTSIPGHLVTREFWQATQRPLAADGHLIANLLLDGALASDYARNLLHTIESVYGRCAVEVLHKTQAVSNVVVSCARRRPPSPPTTYVDERSAADFDVVRSR